MSGPKLGFGTIASAAQPVGVVVARDRVLPLHEVLPKGPRTVQEVIVQWHELQTRLEEAIKAADLAACSHVDEVTWLPPHRPAKILCVGTNYRDHVAEMAGPAGLAPGSFPFPYTFMKPDTALVGSGHTVPHPAYGQRLDWEVELAVVIGDPSAASGPEPLDAVFGYTILNDLSLRDFIPFPHALGLDALVSKGFDGAAPTGPWITPTAYVDDPQNLVIELRVDGQVMQSSSTAQMIFGVRELVSHYARVLTLEPGDLIATGTPAGVGAGRTPPRYLEPADEIEARVQGLGVLRTRIGSPTAPYAPLGAEHDRFERGPQSDSNDIMESKHGQP
jgi:2-keto-4-pentenoate hydratase/2-oxohepta-3-ene-1,7-dioic acid hydratase in catechol pathway